VRHGEVKDAMGAVIDLPSHTQADFAVLRELDCVPDEIEDHLAQSSGIALEDLGHVGGDFARELEALLVRAQRDRLERALERLANLELRGVELEFPGLDLREIENIVDDA